MVFVLLAPIAIECSGLLSDYDRYSEVPAPFFAYHAHEIAEASGDIDLLVLGSSATLTGTDCTYLRDMLTAHLGRPAVVRCLASNWRSEVIYYVILADLLKRRRVKFVLLEEPRDVNADREHAWTHFLWKPLEHGALLSGLPWRFQLAHYAQSILGVPRHLLSLVRRNDIDGRQSQLDQYKRYCGTPPVLLGFKPLRTNTPRQPYTQVDYPIASIPVERMIFRDGVGAMLKFNGRPLSAIQVRGIALMNKLASAHGAHFALWHYSLPAELRGFVHLRTYDPGAFGGYIPVLGASPRDLYAGLSAEQIRGLWKDQSHPNWNGARYNTRAIAPAILALYEQ
jgi:hypothetical protein